jgi:hypothetical protein
LALFAFLAPHVVALMYDIAYCSNYLDLSYT